MRVVGGGDGEAHGGQQQRQDLQPTGAGAAQGAKDPRQQHQPTEADAHRQRGSGRQTGKELQEHQHLKQSQQPQRPGGGGGADRPTGLLLVGEEVDIHPAHGEGVTGIQGGGALHHRAVEQRATGADGVDAPDALAVPAQGGVAAGDGWKINANIRLPGPADHVLPVVQRIACAVGEAEKAPALLFPSGE